MQLKDILTFPVITTTPDSPVADALRLMRERCISALVVTDGQLPVGILTERDAVLLAYRHQDAGAVKVEEVMGKPLQTATQEMDYREAFLLISKQHIRHLAVVDSEGKLAGIVTEGDFLKHLETEFLVRLEEVGAVMSRSVVTLPPDATVDDAVLVMTRQHISCVVVEENGEPLGIFTERDLVRLTISPDEAYITPLARVMVRPVRSVAVDESLTDAIRVMDEIGIRRLVVTDSGGAIIGLVTRSDIVKQLYNRHQEHLWEVLRRRDLELEEIRAELRMERELRAAERALAISEAKYRTLLESLPQFIWQKDRASVYVACNENYANAHGLTPDEIVGRDDLKLYPKKLAEKYREDDCRIMDSGDPEDYEEEWVEQGQQRYLRTIKLPLKDQRGKVYGTLGIAEDITERKRAERALRQSEQRLALIMNTLPTGVQENDVRGVITYSNIALHRILGVKPGRLVGRRIWDFHEHKKDTRKLRMLLPRLVKGESIPAPYVIHIITEDGRKVTLEVTWDYKRDENGKVVGFISAITDITEREQFERSLKKERDLQQRYLDTVQTIMVALDRDGRITMINRTGCELLGYGEQDLLGRNWFETCLPEPEGARPVFQRLLEGDTQGQEYYENSVLCRDGSRRLIAWHNAYLQDDDGHVVGILSSGQDITERKEAEDSLRRRESYLRALIDNFPFEVWLKDTESRFLAVNRPFAEAAGFLDADELKGKTDLDIFSKELADACRKDDLEVMAGRTNKEVEEEVMEQGSSRWLETYKAPVADDDGVLLGTVGFSRDITERKRADEYRRLTAKMFECTAEGITITDPKGNIVDVNRAFMEITGYGRDEVIGQNPKILQSGRHDAGFYRALWQSLEETGQWRGEIWNRRKDGGVYPEWLTISRVTDDDGCLTHYVGVFTDISFIKQSQEQLDHLAHHDALTDLPNRLLLNERLDQAIRRAERHGTQLAVLFLDLDNFKHVNDSLGHPAGDQLLQIVANSLQKTVRQDDTVARIGGDEFVVLLEDIVKPGNAATAAEKLMSIFDEPMRLEGREIGISTSLGISLYPRDGTDPEKLLRNADAAMYRAKADGRNGYQFYTEELTHNAFERILLESSLRLAIDREELLLLYQPQVNLETGRITGVEALIRWQHPELGMVFPAKFILLAEECGLIHPIGNWVLRRASRQAKVWLDQGYEFGRMAINVAGPQIQRGELVQQVNAVLSENALPASCLELEVTEGFIMREAERAIDQLKKLGELGITLAIDDFGTGYSSLSYLKQLPVHKLKIDQSFVRDIPDDLNDVAISNAVVALGKSLGLTVIAEGVETEEQERFLKEVGCEEVQGYRYSPPVTAEELEKMLKGRESKTVA